MKKISLNKVKQSTLSEYSPIEKDEDGKWQMHIEHDEDVPFSEKDAIKYNKQLDVVWKTKTFGEFVNQFKKLDSWRTWDDMCDHIVEEAGFEFEKWLDELRDEIEESGKNVPEGVSFLRMLIKNQDKLFKK